MPPLMCDCAVRSSVDRVFTCPVCVGKTLVMFERELAQTEMFEDIDGSGSVSASSRAGGELTHISSVLQTLGDQGLPF